MAPDIIEANAELDSPGQRRKIKNSGKKEKRRRSIIHGFKKCCISNALDGSEDDVLWEEPAEPEDVCEE